MYINNKYINLVPGWGKYFYTWWVKHKNIEYPEFIKEYHPKMELIVWGSHQPVLLHMLNTIKDGRVIEFGMGYNSTPLLSIICKAQGRKLISMDNSDKYLICFRKFRHPMIKFTDDNVQYPEGKFSLALVDAHPAHLRQEFINNMKGRVDYFIVHDTENLLKGMECPYGYDFDGFRFAFHFKRVHPMTSVISDLPEINEKILTIFE